MDLLTEKAEWAVEFIDLPRAADEQSAEWEWFQIQFLNNRTRFGLDRKSRQVGWSFTAALDAVVDGTLNPNTPHIFTSINQEESQEKIRYVKQIIAAIDKPMRPRILRDSLTTVELENGSRFISHPQRPPRGKPRARVYLDEYAHYKAEMDRLIYTAALPATTKGDGYIRIGSSTMGARGMFWEIDTESTRKWPDFRRTMIPWWTVRAFCRNVPEAASLAAYMSTEERVAVFGTRAIRAIFANMFLEDFQQEYECAYVDEASAWISWATIQKNQDPDLLYFTARNVDDGLALIEDVRQAQLDGLIEPVLYGGIDIGRHRDLTELVAGGRSTTGQTPVRLLISLAQTPFDDQVRLFSALLTRVPFAGVLVDQNGIGMQMAEQLERTGRAEGVTFTNETKELWAVHARLQAERGLTPLPQYRDLAYQIHSIKKKVTAAKNNVFDNDRNSDKHHADMFWAWALYLYRVESGGTETWSGDLGKIENYKNRWT